MSVDIENIAKELLEDISSDNDNVFKKEDKFFLIKALEIDKRGKFGELFFYELLKKIDKKTHYEEGTPGPYDIIFRGFNLEVKTASIGKNETFQSEGIKLDDRLNGVLFLGVTQKDLYYNIINVDTLKSYINKTEKIKYLYITNREKNKSGNGYKFTYRLNFLKKLDDFDKFKNDLNKLFPKNHSNN